MLKAITIVGISLMPFDMAVAVSPVYIVQHAEEVSCQAVVLENYLKAYNAHDIEGVLSYLSEDFRWYFVDGGDVALEVEGKSAVRDGLTGYFKSLPTARSEIGDIIVNGDYLTVRETAFWTVDGDVRQQSSIAVYLISNGMIKTVWYYPSQ
jgi:hypothetical protein